jgi:hypothetical protein
MLAERRGRLVAAFVETPGDELRAETSDEHLDGRFVVHAV